MTRLLVSVTGILDEFDVFMVNIVFVQVTHTLTFNLFCYFLGPRESLYQYGSFDHGSTRECWKTIYISHSVINVLLICLSSYLYSNLTGLNNRLGLEKEQDRDDLSILRYIIGFSIHFDVITYLACLPSST